MSLKSVILFVVICLSFWATEAAGAILTVTTLADTDDGSCDAHCSLREAVRAAAVVNTVAATDTIIFAQNLRGGRIQLANTLVIDKRLNIDGPNKRRITLEGNDTFRIIEARATGIFIDGLIIRNGRAADDNGGGIYSRGVLTLTNVAILNNTALRGGGIYAEGGGNLFIIDSSVAGNTATGDAGAGGIDMYRVLNFQIINSTVSGNRSLSVVDGVGGIRAYESDGSITNSTVVYNSSNGTNIISTGGYVGVGGGLSRMMSNTIIAANTGLIRNIYGSISGQHCLIGNSGAFTNGFNGNIVGTADNPIDPQLAPLTENGGGLPTHALLPTSPALNAGSNERALDRRGSPLTVDQRGYNRIVDSTVDMGAYEFNSQPVVINSLITGRITDASGRGVSRALVTLRDADGEIKTVPTNPFGFYRLANVPNGSYTIEAKHKSHAFPPQNLLAEESTEYANFAPVAQSILR